ncbi:MAG: hypothetical protein GWO16_04795, partial [Gammaproteobacteria bacterium]|nr:hypothetical protein [Gammaproteobacteria bacterium]
RILIYEGPILGWRFAAVRIVSVLAVPLLVGTVAAWLFRLLQRWGL